MSIELETILTFGGSWLFTSYHGSKESLLSGGSLDYNRDLGYRGICKHLKINYREGHHEGCSF